MKKFLTSLFAVALIFAATARANAQDYSTAVGVNLGPAMGISAKHFISARSAIEAGFSYNIGADAPMVAAVYQYHIPLASQFNLYVGGGINIGAIRVDRNSEFAFGLDPTIGFEYAFPSAPIAIAIDYKPAINLNCATLWDEVAFKVRFKF